MRLDEIFNNKVIDLDPEKTRTLFDLDVAAGNGSLDPKSVKTFRAMLDKSADIILYHGTSIHHDVWNKGLLRTSATRARSMQSGGGYVYLAYDPRRALDFAKHAYPMEKQFVVYSVRVPVRSLKADADQLRNKRYWGKNPTIGDSVVDSFIHGGGVRVKGAVETWRLKVHGYFDRAGDRIEKPDAHVWGDDRYR